MNGELIEFQRNQISDNLKKCTTKQQEFFKRIYGEVNNIAKDKLEAAYSIIERTLEK